MADEPRETRPRPPEVFVAQDDLVRRVLDRAGYDIESREGRDALVAIFAFLRDWKEERESLGQDISFLQQIRRANEARAVKRAARWAWMWKWIGTAGGQLILAAAAVLASALKPEIWSTIRDFLWRK